MAERNVAQTFARGLAVLRHLNEHNGASARQLSHLAGINEVITRRLLDTLLLEDYVYKVGRGGRYWLRPQVAALSSGFRDDQWINEIAEPAMKRLGRLVVWPVSLVAPSGLTLTVRTNTDEQSPLTIRKTPIGQHFPWANSASGPIYLAFCGAEERATLISLLWLLLVRRPATHQRPWGAAHAGGPRGRGTLDALLHGGDDPPRRDPTVCGAFDRLCGRDRRTARGVRRIERNRIRLNQPDP